ADANADAEERDPACGVWRIDGTFITDRAVIVATGIGIIVAPVAIVITRRPAAIVVAVGIVAVAAWVVMMMMAMTMVIAVCHAIDQSHCRQGMLQARAKCCQGSC